MAEKSAEYTKDPQDRLIFQTPSWELVANLDRGAEESVISVTAAHFSFPNHLVARTAHLTHHEQERRIDCMVMPAMRMPHPDDVA